MEKVRAGCHGRRWHFLIIAELSSNPLGNMPLDNPETYERTYKSIYNKSEKRKKNYKFKGTIIIIKIIPL
jgi:hypothetical protein